jgi:hypothetical protein
LQIKHFKSRIENQELQQIKNCKSRIAIKNCKPRIFVKFQIAIESFSSSRFLISVLFRAFYIYPACKT